MSFDFAIWRRSPTTKTAMLAEVYESIRQGRDHPAMATFDLPAFEEALRDEFGAAAFETDGLLLFASGSSPNANWAIVECAHSVANEVAMRLIPVALAHELLVYDPQGKGVWGNKRPPKVSR